MDTQNYANHRRYVPMYHGVLFFLLIITFVGSLVNLYSSIGDHQRIYSASLITVLTFCGLIQFWYSRAFATKVQDRAIRAEENLRHFAMTGKLFDPKLKMGQIIALRFASEEEFLSLAKRAIEENLSREDIKKAIKIWREDNYRA
ncbi:MAG: DUF6526 family protein [bacterium]